jgi:hypothetical protein
MAVPKNSQYPLPILSLEPLTRPVIRSSPSKPAWELPVARDSSSWALAFGMAAATTAASWLS